MKDSNAVQMALRARAETAVGYPVVARRAYELVPFTPVVGTVYVAEEFAPATSSVATAPARTGVVYDVGLYFLRVYGPLGEAGRVAILALVDAIKAALSAGWTTTLSNGDGIRINSKPTAPKSGQPTPIGVGWAYCLITIPWTVESVNAVLP